MLRGLRRVGTHAWLSAIIAAASLITALALALVMVLMPAPGTPHMSLQQLAARYQSGLAVDGYRVTQAAQPPADAVRSPLGDAFARLIGVAPTHVRVRGVQVSGTGATDAPALVEALIQSNVLLPPIEFDIHQDNGEWTRLRPLPRWWNRWIASFGIALPLVLLPCVVFAWFAARVLVRPLDAFIAAASNWPLDEEASTLTATPAPHDLARASEALERLRTRVSAHVRERNLLLATLAHDLRTPITTLRLRAEGIAEPTRGHFVTELLRMQSMLDQTMAFLRDGTPAQRTALDVAELMHQRVAQAVQAGEVIHTGHMETAMVLADADALARAIDNLLENAARYAGGGTAHCRCADGMAEIVIEDEGPGLATDKCARAGEPYWRGEPSRNAATGGFGLGLASARTIAEAHGGTLELHALQPHGLEVRLRIPLSVAD